MAPADCRTNSDTLEAVEALEDVVYDLLGRAVLTPASTFARDVQGFVHRYVDNTMFVVVNPRLRYRVPF